MGDERPLGVLLTTHLMSRSDFGAERRVFLLPFFPFSVIIKSLQNPGSALALPQHVRKKVPYVRRIYPR